MFQKWKKAVDQDESFGALVTDQSKPSDCHRHDLLIAKFHCYVISLASVKFLTNDLTNRKQRTKVETC